MLNKILTFTIVTIIILFTTTQIANGQNWLDYGQKCDESVPDAEKCNVGKHLRCNNATQLCACTGEGDLFYDSVTHLCTAFAGKPCDEYPSSGMQEKLCIKNAWCNSTTCQCRNGFMTVSGTCKMGHNYGGCQLFDDCNVNAFLSCSYGTCRCDLNSANVTEQEWDESGDESVCRSLVHADCTSRRPCVTHASCENSRYCSCDKDFQPTQDRHCKKALGTDCSENSECASNNCVGETAKKCACPEGQVEDGAQCRVLPGGDCSVNTECVNFATCDQDLCKCRDGFSPLGNKCVGNHDTACSLTTEDLCNGDIYLECRNSTEGAKCQCRELFDYDTNLNRCQGTLGQECKLDTERPTDCVLSTQCVEEQDGNKCRCVVGLRPGEADTVRCKAVWGQSCQRYQCDDYVYQTCVDSTCQCENDLHYQVSQSKCMAKIGINCGNQVNKTALACIDNASCIDGSESGFTCRCNDNFHPNGDGTECLQGSNGSGTLATSGTIVISFLMLMRFI